ncbi:carboxylesterase family protein [Hymenobacter sp. 15J16-1T3B]|uniref:carboxylesterase family protein n=1 Tax=Hymenobacter sp. 15J16-1T3B TaxID=2886941 RepID=UPI001D12F4DD|nr:carboxylesterase family protein [Hymenobacter sp. 15J16-1T3B]MCC3159976.1 carboxylesterase family protein [Hymenobacter sp. 15J16-1T3B]
MKHLVLLLSLVVGLTWPARAQLDTTGGKFFYPLYPTLVETTGITYGAAPDYAGTTRTLQLDLYQPDNGPATPRPLIILAHGGSFVGGTRTDGDVQELCRRFARLGYVTASIDYRLEPFSFTQFSGPRGVVNAVQDLRAAVRFFRQDAASANQYNINPLYIFAGGSSAGAITAVHLVYLDQQAELDALYPGAPGGLEGNSGTPGPSSAVVAAINLSGALGTLSWLEAGDEPLVSVHGTNDNVVPYGTGPTFTGNVVSGSGAIKSRADAVGVPNTLRTFRGAGHVPYASSVAYMDTTFRTVRDFLRPLLAAASPLPVRLTSFTAERQGADALLRWTTAQEENSAGYAVEASADGRAFHRLGFVPSAAPNTTGHVAYEYRDRTADKPRLRYYRLRQLDLDGQEAFYGPRAVRFAAAASLEVYPNPASAAEAAVLISSAESGPAQLELRDALGRLLSRQPLQLSAGQLRLPWPQLPARPGAYHLLLRSADGSVQQTRLLLQ